jgi:hypothetical protein
VKPRVKVVSLSAVVLLITFGGGAFLGYYLGRQAPPKPSSNERIREIPSKATDTVSNTHTGSTHSSGYSVTAFVLVGTELSSLLNQIVGDQSFRYNAYLLPSLDGFELVLHHSNDVPDLTQEQHDQLLKLLRQRLSQETAKWNEADKK